MISANRKYLHTGVLKPAFSAVTFLLFCFIGHSQNTPPAQSKNGDVLERFHEYQKDVSSFVTSGQRICISVPPSPLYGYYVYKAEKQKTNYLKLNYARPNNQLMSWPNYPLTAWEMERRSKQDKEENKLSNIIAKDIITSILSKKKKDAVIPKF